MSKLLLIFLCTLLLFTSCTPTSKSETPISVIINDENEASDYIDYIIFLGESTTYHLKSRGVLAEGKNTKQVWAPKSGTLMLDPTIKECMIVYPETGEEISLKEALTRKQPKIICLTFGLNGATNFIARGDSYFKYCYQSLVDLIKKESPTTKIIINSCFPIAKSMDMNRYTVDAYVLNSYIDTLNIWASTIAEKNGLIFIDTASALKDKNGYLLSEYSVDDGYHLTAEAYRVILKAINDTLQNKEN